MNVFFFTKKLITECLRRFFPQLYSADGLTLIARDAKLRLTTSLADVDSLLSKSRTKVQFSVRPAVTAGVSWNTALLRYFIKHTVGFGQLQLCKTETYFCHKRGLHWPRFETAVNSQLEFEKDPEISLFCVCVDSIYSY